MGFFQYENVLHSPQQMEISSQKHWFPLACQHRQSYSSFVWYGIVRVSNILASYIHLCNVIDRCGKNIKLESNEVVGKQKYIIEWKRISSYLVQAILIVIVVLLVISNSVSSNTT